MAARPGPRSGGIPLSPALALRGVRVEISGQPAVLDGIDLEVQQGEYLLIAGPTGSGKTALALTILGLVEQQMGARLRGSLRVCGRELSEMTLPEIGRRVAVVRQRPEVQLFRPSVIEEVRSGLDYRGVSPSEGTERARAALRLVGLAGFPETRDPMSLSGGEQQRLALAAALVLETPVLVLDEATSALDELAEEQFFAALDRARAEREMTLIAIDHRLDRHLKRADRAVFLRSGAVVFDGPPARAISGDADLLAGLGLRSPDGAGQSLIPPPACPQPVVGGAGLSCESVSAVAGEAVMLADASFELPQGAVALLIGPNGSGKSTLLRVLAGDLRERRGIVAPRLKRRVRAGIGYASQRAGELPLRPTVLEEVVSAMRHGAGKSAVGSAHAERAAEILDRAGLTDQSRIHPLRLSGGQRQRLAVAIAVTGGGSGDPALVLLDEPTAAQDRSGVDQVRNLIQTDRSHRITLIATHEPWEYAGIATHVLRAESGVIREVRR